MTKHLGEFTRLGLEQAVRSKNLTLPYRSAYENVWVVRYPVIYSLG